jgi:hypothetical protein
MALRPIRQLTETDMAVLDRLQVITLGMGWFFSIKGAFAVLVAIALVGSAIGDLIFALRKMPKLVTSATIERLKPNDYVKLNGNLDYDHAVAFKPVLSGNFTLTPVMGARNRLIVYRKGFLTESPQAVSDTGFAGKVVGRDWFGKWDLEGADVDLVEEFQRRGVSVPLNALVLLDGHLPKVNLWLSCVGVASIGILALVLTRIRRTMSFLEDRRQLAAYVNKFQGRIS